MRSARLTLQGGALNTKLLQVLERRKLKEDEATKRLEAQHAAQLQRQERQHLEQLELVDAGHHRCAPPPCPSCLDPFENKGRSVLKDGLMQRCVESSQSVKAQSKSAHGNKVPRPLVVALYAWAKAAIERLQLFVR